MNFNVERKYVKMYYRKLIRFYDNEECHNITKQTNTNNVVTQPVEPSNQSDHIVKILDERFNKLESLIKIMNVPQTAPKDFDDNILNEDEISEIMSYMLQLQTEYFSDIPLSKELSKKFMWNIPKEIYRQMRNNIDKDDPVILNPILYLYIFCTDYPEFAMGKFILTILNLCDESEYDEIVRRSKEYDNAETDDEDIDESNYWTNNDDEE